MNLQQAYMKRALVHVTAVQEQDANVQQAYGALCHQIPILVLTNGLALTAAFVDAKAVGQSARARAFRLVQRHLIAMLEADTEENRLAGVIGRRDGDGLYMLDTFAILDAWVYYKRFAVSLLGVEAGTDDEALETTMPAASEDTKP